MSSLFSRKRKKRDSLITRMFKKSLSKLKPKPTHTKQSKTQPKTKPKSKSQKAKKSILKRQRSPISQKNIVREAIVRSPCSNDPIRELPALKVVVLDNDECMGQFGFLSLFHQIPFNIKGLPKVKREDLVNSVSKYILGGGAIRPYAAKLLKLLHSLKKQKKIDAVVMYTSASNTAGYVHFLKDCLEKYSDTIGVYDDVIHYRSVRSVRAEDGATRKDFKNVLLRLLSKNGIKGPFQRNVVYNATRNIVMFDDRPYNINIRGGKVIGVEQYCRTISMENMLKVIKNTPNLDKVEGIDQLKDDILEDWDDFGKPDCEEQKKYDKDTDMKKAMKYISSTYK